MLTTLPLLRITKGTFLLVNLLSWAAQEKGKGILIWGLYLTFSMHLATIIFLSTYPVQDYLLVIAGHTKMNEAKSLFLSGLSTFSFKKLAAWLGRDKREKSKVIRGFVWVELPVAHAKDSAIRQVWVWTLNPIPIAHDISWHGIFWALSVSMSLLC